MRLLLTGASGYLGWHFARHAGTAGHGVVGCHLNHATGMPDGNTSVRADFRDAADCRRLLKALRPDAIIHAGAMTNTSACEADPVAATATNVHGTANLLAAAGALDPLPHFVLISTDLVFDGVRGMCREEDPPAPLMHYGRTKLEAERIVARHAGRWTIVRSALIYGPAGTGSRRCFLDWMLEGMRAGTTTLFSDEYRSPVHVDDISRGLLAVVERAAGGLFHMGGPVRLSRAEFGWLAADAFALPRESVLGASSGGVSLAAPRPRDVSLCVEHAANLLGFAPMTPAEGLARVARDA